MADDILSAIKKEFAVRVSNDRSINSFLRSVKNRTATLSDTYEYTRRLGVVLGDILGQFGRDMTPEAYKEMITSIIYPMIEQNHNLVMIASADVQKMIDRKDGLSLGAVKPKVDKEKIDTTLKEITSHEDVGAMISETKRSVGTLTEESFDNFIKSNVAFRFDIGMNPVIVRTYEGKHKEGTKGFYMTKHGQVDRNREGEWVDCEWCKALAGTYDYEDVKDTGNDVFRRHKGCHCQTIYKNNAKGYIQGTHTKTIATNKSEAKNLDVGTMYGKESGTGATKRGSRLRIRYDRKGNEINRLK